MDQLTRIEKLLERIAVALEKQESPAVSYLPITQPWDWNWDKWVYNPGPQCGSDAKFKYSTDTTHLRQRFGVDYSVKVDDCRVPDTCESKFDGIENFGKCPDGVKCTDWNKQSE